MILAIIAVITVPIILNVIDNSKRGAAIDSAYGYRDAIYKGFLTDLSLDSSKELPNGIYVIDNTGKLVNSNGVILTVNVSGIEPDDGWVELNKGEVVAFSLKFGDYVVTKYQDTEVSAEKNGEIAENAEAREARLESERQASAKTKAKTLATSQTGSTEIVEITEGWVAFINGEVKAYSLKVVEGDYTYVVTDMDVNTNNSNAVADRTISDVASTTQAEQLVVSAKVDSYVKAALTANSSLDKEDAKTVSQLGDLSNKADLGWIHFNKVNNSVVVVDYSLTYGTLTANYASLDGGKYMSTFGESRNKPTFVAVGSEICYGPSNAQECFKVIKTDSNKTLLFANYNLKKYTDNSTNPTTVTYKQESSSTDAVSFSSSAYWDNSGLKSEYEKDINNEKASYSGNPYPYVYNLQGTDTNNVKPYVDGYVSNLKTATYGLPSSATGRLLTYEEANNTSMFANSSARNNGKYYWLGSAYASNFVWNVNSSGNFYGNPYHSNKSNNDYIGVRPVIEISTSDIQ